jgi:HlyD family secretion protein
VVLVLGFALLFALLFRDRLLPAPELRVVIATAIADESIQPTSSRKPVGNDGRLLFQASGWLEPDPLPVRATALADGVIAEVHVLEGQRVDAGDLLVSLIDEDARLVRDMMASELAMKQAAFDAHCVEVQTLLQKLAAEQAGLAKARATLDEATDLFDRLARVPVGATTESQRVTARFEKERGNAEVDMARARIREIAWDFNRIAYETLAHHHGIEAAKSALAEAELNLMRTRVPSPVRGRVMRLLASPGEKKMLGMDEMDSATVALIYDPEKLQVRVDVPLADAAQLAIGQRAKIRCGLLPDVVFEGIVTRIAGEADIQRNTLQAKVRVLDPDDRLRPEMICRVEFFGETVDDDSAVTTNAAGNLAVFVPPSAVAENSRVWVCDPESKRVESREVVPTRDVRERWMRIESGINPGEWIVDDPAAETLKPGQRIHPLFNR